jgi:hypothetical protein
MVSLAMYQPVDVLIEGYPYTVAFVDRWLEDIFVVLTYNYIEMFELTRIPQRCHETFTRFLMVFKENNVEDLNLEYLGNLDNEEPLLNVYGGGFCTYVW